MTDAPIWRYLSLTKYLDLLRTRSIYFPKAALFSDETEGMWWGHAQLYESARHWAPSPANVKTLQLMLQRAGNDQGGITRELTALIPSANEWVRNILLLSARVYPSKQREFIEETVAGWKEQYNDHNPSADLWKADLEVERQATYISCWNRASSMSLAMWEMYGGGREAVAVSSTRKKLNTLIRNNALFLERENLEGAIADVEYVDGLKHPNEEVHQKIYEIMFGRDRDYRIGLFAIKPSIYEFEQEVRALLFPKRELLDPIQDPHPEISGMHLSLGSKRLISEFIEKVYVHPTLSEDSMIFKVVTDLHKKLGVPEIPVVAERIEAMGLEILLPPMG
jgi:hypothetical protein